MPACNCVHPKSDHHRVAEGNPAACAAVLRQDENGAPIFCGCEPPAAPVAPAPGEADDADEVAAIVAEVLRARRAAASS